MSRLRAFSPKHVLSGGIPASLTLFTLLNGWGCGVTSPPAAEAQATAPAPTVISECDAPFLFAYGTWEKLVRVEGGRALLRGTGLTPKGGAGSNIVLDLSGAAEKVPVLKVKVGAENRMVKLRLLLKDDAEGEAIYDFSLPAPGESAVTLSPHDGASLSTPNEVGKKGKLNLARVRQWQIIGDWGGDHAVDLEVDAILLGEPDATAREAQAARDRRVTEEREQKRREGEALRARYGTPNPLSPVVDHVYLAAPDILALNLQAGRVVPGKIGPYQAEPGDQKKVNGAQTVLVRNKEEVGWLIGTGRDTLVRYEKLEGDPLLEAVADDPASYTVRSAGDPSFASGVKPTAVFRKSKPTDWAQPSRGFALRHTVYLKLPRPLTTGKTYTIDLGAVNVRTPRTSFTCEPARTRSEAVHVSQIGFRPDDPAKRAYLSLWMGTGDGYRFPDGLAFHLVEDGTGESVYTGKVELAKAAEEPEKMPRSENFNKTHVYRMDFSAFRTPGKYRVVVERIGCSYPFEIGPKVWERAFITQMRGLFNNRSGVALGPPYTPFRKPRDFHPADGAKIFQSTCSILEEKGEFEVAKRGADQPVPEAWGGYHDAGDWNPRRATHLRVTMAHLEIAELFPAYYKGLRWNIPRSTPAPDILNEALFELDLFRRLQKPEGGVPYGIETGGDPIEGEVSWNQSMPAYVFAPDLWSSYLYAATAARYAGLVAPFDAGKAKLFRESALKAMQWAESEWAKLKTAGTLDKLRWEVQDDRNLAAVLLYGLTGETHWHDLFLEDTCLKDPNAKLFVWSDHVQRDAAFAYARLPQKQGNATLKANAVRALAVDADTALTYAKGNAWGITSSDPGKPLFLGFYSTPHGGVELVRAYHVTKKPEYLAGAVQACLFPGGANPNNMTYTVGLGVNYPRNPLHLDSRRSGQPAPEGITVYGNYDFIGWDQEWANWPLKYHLSQNCKPTVYEWPLTEAYFDIFLYPATNEFTVDIWAPNLYVWGYLAARK